MKKISIITITIISATLMMVIIGGYSFNQKELLEVGHTKPNIIVIMTDDLDTRTLNKLIKVGQMPNLKNYLIDNGLEFTNSFVTHSMCCPSRSTFLTGQYAHNHGVLGNSYTLKLDDSQTVATWLNKSGYHTGLIGKYLNGYGKRIPGTYIPPGWDEFFALVDPYNDIIYNYKINENGKIINYGDKTKDYQTDVLSEKAVNFIFSANDHKPFFLFLTPMAPHSESSTKNVLFMEVMITFR